MRETWVRSLGWEDPLEKGKATYPRILAWRIAWPGEVHGVAKSRTRLSDFTFTFFESRCSLGEQVRNQGYLRRFYVERPTEVIAEPGSESPMLFLLIHLPLSCLAEKKHIRTSVSSDLFWLPYGLTPRQHPHGTRLY